MYSIQSYGQMIADRVRTDAYAEAMRRAIKPGSLVLEIGTGIGFFAVLAHRLGARRVVAIEPDASIHVAREVAIANGGGTTIEFLSQRSDQVTLQEPADVIVSDLRGVLPLLTQHVPSIIDARKRLLAPHGTLIPQRDRLWGAVIEAPEEYQKIVGVWEEPYQGIDLRAGRRLVTNTTRKAKITPDQLLSEACSLAEIDYRTVASPNLEASIRWVAQRSGTAHGYGLWFDTELFEGVGFSNAPGLPEAIYGKMFFPLAEPITLAEGDHLVCRFRASLVGDDYVWQWDTEFSSQEPATASRQYSQSTFLGTPLAVAQLRKRAADYRPTANEDGQIDRQILALMTGELTSRQIADQLRTAYPGRFRTPTEALTRVGLAAERYST
jgi:protein arginine N-methyltransferase 1